MPLDSAVGAVTLAGKGLQVSNTLGLL